jgi:hypothetical protein
VAHLTPTVDLTALRPSGGPRPSGRPGASNAHIYIYIRRWINQPYVPCDPIFVFNLPNNALVLRHRSIAIK